MTVPDQRGGSIGRSQYLCAGGFAIQSPVQAAFESQPLGPQGWCSIPWSKVLFQCNCQVVHASQVYLRGRHANRCHHQTSLTTHVLDFKATTLLPCEEQRNPCANTISLSLGLSEELYIVSHNRNSFRPNFQ